MKIALIDGDAIIYILAWQFKDQEAHGDSYDQMLGAVDQIVIGILQACSTGSYIGALGHPEQPCFRYSLAKYKPYKGTRKEKDDYVKMWEPIVRQRLLDEWKFISIAGLEADDIVAIAADECINSKEEYVICSPDKDLWQIPGYHYDYRKLDFADINLEQAEYFFAYQLLVGDTTDNIAGLPGVGDKKAKEKLAEVDLSSEFYEQHVRNMYTKYFGDHYGNVIFEENKIVLGLVTRNHPQYNVNDAVNIMFNVQTKEIQNTQNDILKELGWTAD